MTVSDSGSPMMFGGDGFGGSGFIWAVLIFALLMGNGGFGFGGNNGNSNAIQADVKTNYSYFPIVVDEVKFGAGRDDIYKELAENDIIARKYFYPLTNSFSCFAEDYNVQDTPIALYVSERVLTLPLYADLTMEEVDRICKIILQCSEMKEK